MRNFYALIIFLFLWNMSFEQAIQNSNFENWTTVNLYEDPQGMLTSNLQSFINTYSPNITKSTVKHSGNYALKMETKITATDTIVGLVTNGTFKNSNIVGGIPYTQRPDSISLWAKPNLMAGDTAAIFTVFKKQSNIIGMVLLSFTGTTSNFQYYSENITWLVPTITPDTMLFVMVSSDPDKTPVTGSSIIIDDLKFGGTLIPGGDFDTWIMHSYEDANHWSSFNYVSVVYPPPYVTKTTDSYSGSYAMKITTKLFNNNQDTLSVVTNGKIMMDNFLGGMPVNQNPKRVTGYYKYIPVGFDSALVALRSFGMDNNGTYKNIDNNLIKLPAAANYTFFEINLHYTGYPPVDTLGIAFSSSNVYDGYQWAKEGSELIIDSLNIEYYPVGIAENIPEKRLKVYPNPAATTINFDLPQKDANAPVKIYDSRGSLVFNGNISNKSLDISNFATGLYFYEINTRMSVSKGKFSVKH